MKKRRKSDEFLRLSKDFDILLLQETFVHQSTRQVSFPGFHLIKRDAIVPPRGRPVGGLAFLVSFAVLNYFRVEVEDVSECPYECLMVRFSRLPSAPTNFPSTFFLLNVYVPAYPAPVNYLDFQTFLEGEFQNRVLLDPFVVAGDFNCHDPSRRPGFRQFSQFMTEEGFCIAPDCSSPVPTFISHKGASVIDFVFSRGFKWKPDGFSIFPFESFGHRMIIFEFLFPALTSFPLSPRTSFRKHLRCLPGDDFFDSLRESRGWKDSVMMLRDGVSAVFAAFLCCLSGFLFEVRPPEALDAPWERYLSFSELRDLRHVKQSVANLSRNFVIGDDVSLLVVAQRELSSLSSSLRQLALSRFTESIRGSSDDPGLLWKTVRNFRMDPCAAQGLPVEALCHHFQHLFNRASDLISLPFVYPFSPVDAGLDSRFTLEDLDRALAELKRNVAPGPSGTGNDAILDLQNVPGFRKFLLDLYNACLMGGSIPSAWGKCEMFLLYKGKGDPLIPNSYRAIALLDGFLKVYERLLFFRLSGWAHRLELIPPSQFGFRRRSGTLDAIFVFLKLIDRFVFQRRGVMFAALIDFKSAFPSVDRSLLFHKLAKFGLSRRFGFALHSLFENNTFLLRFDSGVTEEFTVGSGLREGSVLSPLLFSLFISDMETSVLKPFDPSRNFLYSDFRVAGVPFPGLLYADDLIILARNRFCLKERLRRLRVYVEENKLTVNVGKCEVVCFGEAGCPRFSFGGQVLPVRDSCKYLGMSFSSRLGFKAHLESISARFPAAVTLFFQLIHKLQVSNLGLLYRLMTSLLLSTLYGIEFASDKDTILSLEVAFRKGLRSHLGVPPRVSNDCLALLFPQFSFASFVLKRKLGFLRRSLLPSDTLASVFFLEDRAVDFPAGHGFSADLLSLLRVFGLPELVNCDSKADVCRVFEEELSKESVLCWERLRGAKSTEFMCKVFGDPILFYEAALFASALSPTALRVFLLMWTGSVSIHLFGSHERVCRFCQGHLDSRHYFGCTFDTCQFLQLIVLARNRQFEHLVRITCSHYFTFFVSIQAAGHHR